MGRPGQQRLPNARPGIRLKGLVAQIQCGRVLSHQPQCRFQLIPAADVSETEINDRRETEDDHEKLEHFGVNRRGQSAFQHINQHHRRTNPETHIVVPAEQQMQQTGQAIHGNTRREHRHDRERN